MYHRQVLPLVNLINSCARMAESITSSTTDTSRRQAFICLLACQGATNYSQHTREQSLLKRRHFEQLVMQVSFASPWIFSFRLKHPHSNWRKSGAEQRISGVVTAAFNRPMYQWHSSSQTWKSINWKQERFEMNHLCLFLSAFSLCCHAVYGLK